MRTVALGRVAEIERDGIAPDKIQSGTPYLGLEHIESGGRILSFEPVDEGELASTKFRFGPDHVLYGKLRPYLAKIAMPDFEGICSTDIVPVRPGPDLDKRYLAYFLRQPSMVAFASSRATGANLPRLSPKALAEFQIPLPPLPEQQRIAVILDQADEVRRLRSKALARHSELGQAIFYEMFGDPAKNAKGFKLLPLRQIAVKFSDGPFGSNLKSSHYVEEGVRVIRLQNIGVGEFVDNDRAYISQSHFASLRKHECLPGDILVGTLGDPNLRACIQPDWLPQALNKADCVQVRVNPAVANNEYICALLNIPSVEAMAHSLVLGQTRARISMGRLRDLEVPIAPKKQQDEFSKVIAQLKKQVQFAEDALQAVDRLFASLQHRAFRGEL